MADFNSSLPIRTQNPGDAVVGISDATTPSQQLKVNADGSIDERIFDVSGNGITSTTISAHQALDVNVANTITTSSGVPDETAFTYGVSSEQPVGGVYQDTSPTLTAGTTGAVRLTQFRGFHVNLRTSAGVELGNTAADKLFVQPTDGTNSQAYTAAGEAKVDLTSSAAFGSASGGTAATTSDLVGGIYNSTPPTLTNGQQASLQLDSSGALLVDGSAHTQPISGTVTANQGTPNSLANGWPVEITDGTNVLGTAAHPIRIDPTGTTTQPVSGTVSASNFPATVDTNYGTVGASTIRTAAQIGNATGAASFNSGATGAQTLRVEANQGAANATPWNENIAQFGGSSVSLGQKVSASSMPVVIASDQSAIPVTIVNPPTGASSINDYKDASAIAAGSSDNHDYTVTSGKTLHLEQVESSGSGKAKMEIQIETGVATNVFTSKFVQFNSTADTNMSIILSAPISVAAGVRVRAIMSNRDLLAQDLYSTICGYEV